MFGKYFGTVLFILYLMISSPLVHIPWNCNLWYVYGHRIR